MTRLARGALAGALALGAAGPGCGDSLPVPRTGPHVSGEPVVVPYPPPPAKVEIVEDPPPQLAQVGVWVDGSWLWTSRRWEWQAGRWQEPIEGAYYARPTTVRRGDGTLVWFPGAWQYETGAPDGATATAGGGTAP